ncbi:MAG TPA: enoyl-CoA hydratase-related protein [Ohtaekwangia sp.]
MNYIQYTVSDRIGYITLNRPEKRNALNFEVVAELKTAFAQAEADDQVKVVILRAIGESFCAGADLAYLQQLQHFSVEENLADSNHLKELFHQIYTLKKVVIAQVQGNALAGGCGLVNVCDFAFAVPEARFGYTEVRIGFIPAIVMVFLIRKVGEANARHLVLTGDLLPANDVKNMGLIYQVIQKEKLEVEVLSFAQRIITSNSAHALMLTKQMIASVQSMKLEDALVFASKMNANARGSDDCKKGIDSFLKKEKITW